MSNWLLIRFMYFAVTVFVYEAMCCLAPVWFTFHQVLAKLVFGAVLSNFVFEMTKECIFKKRVNPRNKAVFISGCDSGFGKLVARQLDAKGFHVFAGCLSPTEGGATELKKTCSERLRLVHVDVTNDEIVMKAKEFIEQNLGTCDLWAVVNNAGVYKGFDIELTSLTDFREVFEVNALGQVRVTKALLPILKRARGRVVNINSLAGRLATAHMAAYAMSKHASAAFTDCLRQEMDGWGVQVISVEPEFFKTPMTNSSNIRQYLEAIMTHLDPGTRAEYSPEYFDRVKVMMERTFGSLSSPRIELVTQAIVDAVSSQKPCRVYKPCGNWARKVWYHLVENFAVLAELFLKGFFVYWGVPKPKK